ncbi:MAG TPA: hypothetical protein VI792_00625 [Candidatus Eisenbacteria bacterium]
MKSVSGGRMLAVTLAAAVLVFGGCSKSSNVTGLSPAQQTADEVALQAGASASADNGGLMTEVQGTTSSVPTSVQPASPYRITATDTTFTSGSFTITLSRTFYDGSTNALPQWGPTAVRAVVNSWLRGTASGLQYQATVGRTGVLNVSGLAASVDTLVFDGTATDTTDAQFTSLDGARTVYVHVLATRILAAVQLLKNRSANPWPLSGTATWNLAVDKYVDGTRGTIQVHYTALVVVTFNGTQYADMVVNGTYHYKLNLQTGTVVRA